jgi:hypothetical protein
MPTNNSEIQRALGQSGDQYQRRYGNELIIFVLQDFMNEWLAEYGGIYCRSLANVSRIARSWSRVVSSAAAVQSSNLTVLLSATSRSE